MTLSVLDRSALLAASGYETEMIVLDPLQQRSRDIKRLTARGVLPAAGQLKNLWDILADTAEPPRTFGLHARDPRLDDSHPAFVEAGIVRARTRFAADGKTVLQIDHYRPDGSLLAIDRRDVPIVAGRVRRRVTLFRRDGTPSRVWRRIWSLYRFVFDSYLADTPTILFYDSKLTSRFATRYHRPHVQSVHVLHSRHLANGEPLPFGTLVPSRDTVLQNLEAFDLVVCSTTQQRNDLAALLSNPSLIRVIPPVVPSAIHEKKPERRPFHGVVLSSLIGYKRLSHLIDAVAIARKSQPELTLDIYGEGAERDRLGRQIQAAGIDGAVRLRGYQANAKRHFAEASWTAMTSKHEGFGMVLAEAMTRGCAPFAYDIAYGPAEVLDGFPSHLVPAADKTELAARIVSFHERSTADRAEVRAAMIQAAHRFDTEQLSERWNALIESLITERSRTGYRPIQTKARTRTVRACCDDDGIRVEADFAVSKQDALPRVLLGVSARGPALEWRREAQVRRLTQNRVRASVLLSGRDFSYAVKRAQNTGVDIVAVVGGAGAVRTTIALDHRMGSKLGRATGVHGPQRWVRALRRELGEALRATA